MIDTHCHLTFPDFQEPRFPGGVPAVLAAAAAQGVSACISISTTHLDAAEATRVAEAYPNVWCSAGVHPLYAGEGPHDWAALSRLAARPRCVAWGELGLDNHYDEPAKSVQRAVLDEQLATIEAAAAEGLVKPVVIHCREAFADLIPVLRRTSLDPGRFVFHCFTGTREDMKAVLDFGACVSFTGVITYRNAGEQREAAKMVPAGRFMVETDAPFLSPDPHRAVRPCQPWMVSVTARALAAARGERFEDLHAEINRTTARFFGIPAA